MTKRVNISVMRGRRREDEGTLRKGAKGACEVEREESYEKTMVKLREGGKKI